MARMAFNSACTGNIRHWSIVTTKTVNVDNHQNNKIFFGIFSNNENSSLYLNNSLF